MKWQLQDIVQFRLYYSYPFRGLTYHFSKFNKIFPHLISVLKNFSENMSLKNLNKCVNHLSRKCVLVLTQNCHSINWKEKCPQTTDTPTPHILFQVEQIQSNVLRPGSSLKSF